MLRRVRAGVTARTVAALLVVAFTGAPRIASSVAEAGHAGEHRCRCAARGANHECSCPICKRAKARARASEDDSGVPPCHRKAAEKAPARPEPAPAPAQAPCIEEGSCDPQGPRAVLTGLEPYTLPQADLPVGPSATDSLPLDHGSPPSASVAPDVPPPRS